MSSRATANVTIVNGHVGQSKPNGFIVFLACFLFLAICKYPMWGLSIAATLALGVFAWVSYWRERARVARLSADADQQHAWVMQGDLEHGVYGQPKED